MFDEQTFDAPVPEHYLREMNVCSDDQQSSENINSRNKLRQKEQSNLLNGSKYSESFKVKYKTEMCKNWETTGHCEFEDSCSFAHGCDELKQKTDVPKNYKTKLCKRYHKEMYCPYGARCQFLHGEASQDKYTNTVVITQKPKRVSKKKVVCVEDQEQLY